MPKKLVWLACIVLACSCLGGCQLARDGAVGEENGEDDLPRDKLVGVYITCNQYLNSDENYYATPSLIEEDGYETTTFKFEGIPGIAFFEATVKGEKEIDSYRTAIFDSEIIDGSVSINVHDDGADLVLTGTLYVLDSMILYMNPVYQTPAGEIYMLPGIGNYAGSSMSIFLDDTIDSQEEKYSAKVTVDIEAVDMPEQDVLKEINSKDEIIKTTVITPEDIPDSISLHRDCAYVIAETHSRGEEGLEVTRVLMDTEDSSFIYKYAGDRGFLVGKLILIKWNEGGLTY